MGKGKGSDEERSRSLVARGSSSVGPPREVQPQPAPSDVQIARIVQSFSFAKHATTWGGSFGISVMVYKSIAVIAGKTTVLKAVFELAAQIGFFPICGWIAAVVCFAAYKNSERQRKRLIAEYAPGRERLERLLDTKRSSSGLDQFGDTPDGDVT